jgi:hypothetical protein
MMGYRSLGFMEPLISDMLQNILGKNIPSTERMEIMLQGNYERGMDY